jgi:hypothetical protein
LLYKVSCNSPSFIFFIMETLLIRSLYKLESSLYYKVSVSHSKLVRIRPITISANFIVIYLSICGLRKIMYKLMNSIILARGRHIPNSIIDRIVPITTITRTIISLFKGLIYCCFWFFCSIWPNFYIFIIITFRNPVKATSCMSIPSKWTSNYIRTFNKFSFIKE